MSRDERNAFCRRDRNTRHNCIERQLYALMSTGRRSAFPHRPYLAATRAFATRESSPRDYLEQCIAQIEVLEPKIGAFVTLNFANARKAADESTKRWRAEAALSPIDGMPIGIKDIIETEDMPTEQGSPIFAGYRTGRDAASVAALREAGAVIIGKTVTTEFAATEPGGTRNPWSLDRTPGGSSSGSAAAVAAGMVPAALGTQVIGSILRPASYCGVYGFKPSVGAINRGGTFDNLSQSCDGALAIGLADLWNMLREIAVRVGGDPGHAGLDGPRDIPAPRKPAALAVLETSGWAVAEPAALVAFERVANKLRSDGVTLLTRRDTPAVADVEHVIADAGALSRSINAWESRWPLSAYRGRPGLSQAMRDRLAQAEAMSQQQYESLLVDRAKARQTFARLAALCDGCITLSAPGPAPIGLHSTGDPVFVIPSSMLGVPALSLPLLKTDDLPLGFQVLGFERRDADAVALAAWIDHVAK